MSTELVTVFGGTGYLGRNIVSQLADSGMRVRIAVRHPASEQTENVEQMATDVRDESTVAAAVSGAHAVVNAVGLYVERGEETFHAVHVRGAMHVARQAKQHDVKRLVHVSGIGVDAASASAYVRARARGEQRVRKAFEDATIVRPSVLFGPDDAFLTALDRLIGHLPVIPLFGTGEMYLQPVYVGDVAAAVTACLTNASAPGRDFELGGAETYTYREILSLVLHHRNRRRALLPVPFVAWEVLASGLAMLPTPPLTGDQIALMRHNNVVHPGAASFGELDIEPSSLRQLLPLCLDA